MKRERTIKTRMRSSKGGRRNKVKAIRGKRGQEDSRAEGREKRLYRKLYRLKDSL